MLSLHAFSKPDWGTNAHPFCNQPASPGHHLYMFHIASHTGTRVSAIVDSATHAATAMLSLLPSSKTDRHTPTLSRLSSGKPPATIRETSLSLFAFSKPHRNTNLSLIACSTPRWDINCYFLSCGKPRQNTNLIFLVQPATPGHQHSACFHPASYARTPTIAFLHSASHSGKPTLAFFHVAGKTGTPILALFHLSSQTGTSIFVFSLSQPCWNTDLSFSSSAHAERDTDLKLVADFRLELLGCIFVLAIARRCLQSQGAGNTGMIS